MKSTCSIFAAKVFFSLLAVMLSADLAWGEENYSLWPKRPDAFAKAGKLFAEGKTEEAITELTPFIKEKGMIGREAREMLGNIRIKQVLDQDSGNHQIYTVKRGDVWHRVATRTKCPIDYLMHANQLMELGHLQIGQQIYYKDLDYRIEVNVKEREISLWDGDSFIKSYPIVVMYDEGRQNFITSIKSETASLHGNNVGIYSPYFASADKTIQLAHGNLLIAPSDSAGARKPGFYLKKEDCNELALLSRPGNEVNIIRE